MYTVIIPIIWEEDQFKKSGFQKSKPLIDVLGKPMVEKFLEIFKSKNFIMNFLFIVNESQLTNELEQILTSHGTIIKKQDNEDILCAILNSFSHKINHYSRLIIANYSQYIDWDFDDFLSHCQKHEVCSAVFYTSDKNYNYIKVNDDNFLEKIRYRSEVSNLALPGIYFFSKAINFFKAGLNIYNAKIKINNIFDIDLVYQEFLKDTNISTYNIHVNNLYLLNTPIEFRKNIQRLKQRFLNQKILL